VRIAIDGRELQGQPTGVGRFLQGVMSAWDLLPDARRHEFVVLSPAPSRGSTAWEQIALPRLVRASRADVLFAPAYTGPLRCPVPMVVAIYDVSFAAHPDWFGWREGTRRRLLTRLAARRAARVLTTSQFSRDEIARLLDVTTSKIDVVYPGIPTGSHGADPVGRPREPERRTPATRDNTVLYVGSLFTRRHIPELIEGFAQVARARPDVRLEIVGDNRTTPRIDAQALVRASGAAERIALRSYVTDEALAALYGRARAFVFLSEYEGFGLTPLEALAAGVPIVVLDTPVAREVYGDAALYVPRPEPSIVAAALDRVLADDAERARIRAAAARVLPRYSWRTCAARILDALTTAAA
jgi:glycosyltransferase involved in cell wall biosynthesis